MDVDLSKAKAAGRKTEYEGKTYYLCSQICKRDFDSVPARFIMWAATMIGGKQEVNPREGTRHD